ncbi:RidA family protein [Yinghuangia sp. YIM S10712]|uniref:RidA family protein n=1 Tax=Yinghuangia sp. YIM S10712 TaxID=3436930 RepID=UPI003F53A120
MAHRLANPAGLHNPVGYGYSHIADAPNADLVFVAGQYASDAEGHVVSDEFAKQVEQSFANVGRALAAEGLDFSHVAVLRTYIVGHDEAKLNALVSVISGIWGEKPPAQTLLGVAALALPDMLFEVDAIAVRP